ncbi:MAG: hypothetical protein RJB66_239 [Pseudomonadota bacterium]|jgi:hypothetical protein
MSEKIIWFKRKKYGIGWTPCTWQGWLITLGYSTSIVAPLILIHPMSKTVLYIWYGYIVAITIANFYIMYRYGEPLKWRWGNSEDKK